MRPVRAIPAVGTAREPEPVVTYSTLQIPVRGYVRDETVDWDLIDRMNNVVTPIYSISRREDLASAVEALIKAGRNMPRLRLQKAVSLRCA